MDKDSLWAATEEGSLFQLERETLSPVQRIQVEGPIVAAPLVLENLVVVASQSRQVLALSSGTGEVRWRFRSEGPVEADPVEFEGAIIVVGASGDGRVYVIDPGSGEGTARFKAGGRIAEAPHASAGQLLITSDDGVLYAFSSVVEAR